MTLRASVRMPERAMETKTKKEISAYFLRNPA